MPRERQNPIQKMKANHHEDDSGCMPLERSRCSNTSTRSRLFWNHQQNGYSHDERTRPGNNYNDQDHNREQINFNEKDARALLKSVEKFNRLNNIQGKEESYRDLQKLLSKFYKKIRNYEEDLQLSSHISDRNIDHKVNPHIEESIVELEREINFLEDEFNPKLASSRIRDSSKKKPEDEHSSRDIEILEWAPDNLYESLPLLEGSINSIWPSQSSESGMYECPSIYVETNTQPIKDGELTTKWPSNYDNSGHNTSKRNSKHYSENKAYNDVGSHHYQELQNHPSQTKQQIRQKANRNKRHNKIPSRMDQQRALPKKYKESSEPKMEGSPEDVIREQLIPEMNDESSDFASKTIIIQTVRKYPPYPMGTLCPVSRVLNSTCPETSVYRETLYHYVFLVYVNILFVAFYVFLVFLFQFV